MILYFAKNVSYMLKRLITLAPSVSGLLGFLANCLVIPVLCTKKMSNTFNRILVMLAVFDNVYVMCSMLEAIRDKCYKTFTAVIY
jgi:hypothetical protein